MSRHKNGTPFRPTSFAREMWIGRKVQILARERKPALNQRREDGFVLAVQGEVAWLWIYDEPKGRIERVDSSRNLRLFSGEKPSESYDRRGYVRINLPSGHPYANTGGWQYAHRLAMAALLGRKPYRYESIGHRDRLPDTNEPDNLVKLSPAELSRVMSKPQRRVPSGVPEAGRWAPVPRPCAANGTVHVGRGRRAGVAPRETERRRPVCHLRSTKERARTRRAPAVLSVAHRSAARNWARER